MVYRRPKRPSFYFEAKQRVGYKQLCTDTADKRTGQRIEFIWATLADKHAWDLLEPIVADLKTPKAKRVHTIGRLLDLYDAAKGNLEAMRAAIADVDLEPVVAEWNAIYATQVEADTAAHALVHVRHFFPAGTLRPKSSVTADWLTTELATYPGKRNTRRKVHSSLSGFFDYCVLPKRLFAANPMLHVARPAQQKTLPVFYEAATVARIVGWQPTAERAAFFALVYGGGADVTPALAVAREDINAATHEVRIAGTKTDFRDRIVRISDALWPIVWKHAKTVLHGPVFDAAWSRYLVSDWHRQTIGAGNRDTTGAVVHAGLALAKRLPLRKARHHFAVRLLQSGASIRVVAEMLGSDERTVLKYYGPWITSSADRARAEQLANEDERRRRKANEAQ